MRVAEKLDWKGLKLYMQHLPLPGHITETECSFKGNAGDGW
jgi:hypothetical protein